MKVLATKPDDLGSVPRGRKVLKVVASTYRLWHEHAHIHVKQINTIDKIFLKRRREDEKISNALQ